MIYSMSNLFIFCLWSSTFQGKKKNIDHIIKQTGRHCRLKKYLSPVPNHCIINKNYTLNKLVYSSICDLLATLWNGTSSCWGLFYHQVRESPWSTWQPMRTGDWPKLSFWPVVKYFTQMQNCFPLWTIRTSKQTSNHYYTLQELQ